MNKLVFVSLLTMALSAGSVASAQAADATTPAAAPAKEMTPQQQKMKDCNADAKAKSLKGDERKKFMSQCLKADKS